MKTFARLGKGFVIRHVYVCCCPCTCSYYRALDAPKTGVEVVIPHQYKCNLRSQLPPWHSRRVKEEARAAALGRRNSSSTQQQLGSFRQCASRVCRWVVVHLKGCARSFQNSAASVLVFICNAQS
jgi:hypothetical protein